MRGSQRKPGKDFGARGSASWEIVLVIVLEIRGKIEDDDDDEDENEDENEQDATSCIYEIL